nr:monocarboxylate transporter 13-like [Procambarus clarkii]XP_045606100.1 monocarboxylate transporter 13-like [Procambarus clarkii]XP_045606101.1 monocarboxylate transporter 13-like [Procambarus clarkii]
MGSKTSKKLVPNRPPPRVPATGPTPTKMVARTRRKMVPPDGGWGWMVVLGSCLSLFFFPAVTVAFGVLFRERLQELGSGATAFTIIANGLSISWSFMALLMAPLCELFGYRRMTIAGGLLAFLTLVLCAFSTSVVAFGLVYSVLGGMACAMSTFSGMVIITRYFDRHKGLTNGIIASAAALGKITMAPVLRVLLDQYGYMWACLLTGALSLHACVSGMLYQPPEWHLIPEKHVTQGGLSRQTSISTMSVTITENGVVEQKDAEALPAPPPRTADDDEGENVIYVMPTTPTTVHPIHKDDEVVLFSRSCEVPPKRDIRSSKVALTDSRLSLFGSMPLLTPVEYKVYDDGDDVTQQSSCWGDCLLVKVFSMLNYAMVREPRFHLIAWPNALAIAATINLMYALPGYVASIGYTPYLSAFAISIFSATEAVFRLVFAALSDHSWFPIELAYTAGFTFSALSIAALPLWRCYAWIMGCLVVNGVAMSLTNVLLIHMVAEHLGLQVYAQAVGFFSLINGLVIVVGGSTTGFIRDYTDSYKATFFWIAAVIAVAAGVWISRCCFKTITSKYNKVSNPTQ